MSARTLSARWPMAVGLSAVVLMLGALGAWSIGTEIAGAIVAPGTVEVETERQVIQHQDGGVVGEILVRDGDAVAAGDVLIRLDGTFLRSELAVVERQLAEIFARRARLDAESRGASAPDFDGLPELALVAAAAVQEQIDGQAALFEARRTALAREQAQIAEQQRQTRRQIEGIEAQLAALDREAGLIGEELANVTSLFERGLVRSTRRLDLERDAARLDGEIGRLIATAAEARARISGLEIESLRLAEQRREDALSRLRDLHFSEIELEERRISLTERLARLDLRAPVAGVVFGSRVQALQSVVQPAEPMLYLVPGDQPMQVSARIDPIDVDAVFAGQDVSLMFTTFSRRTTPVIPGRVIRVSADAETDAASGATYYEAVVVPDAGALAAAPDLALLPGMPVEAFLRTEDRTPLSYLTQPLTVYFNRAFREE